MPARSPRRPPPKDPSFSDPVADAAGPFLEAIGDEPLPPHLVTLADALDKVLREKDKSRR